MSITLDGTNGITTPDVDSTTSVTTPLVTSSGALALSTTSANAIIASTNGVERMRITSAGNIGIGTSSPAKKLHVVADTGDSALFGGINSGTGLGNIGGIQLGTITDTANRRVWGIKSESTQAGMLGFWVSSSNSTSAFDGTQVVSISRDGNVLVGTATDPASGRIVSMGRADGGLFAFISDQSPFGSGSIGHIRFVNSNGPVGQISTSGSSTSYNTSSDYRLKEDVQPVVNPVDRLKQLKPVNFAWKVDGSRVDGFLAHEAQEVVPESVTGEKNAVDKDGNPVYQGIDQSKLVPLLTAALQEALQKIEALTARITALETAND